METAAIESRNYRQNPFITQTGTLADNNFKDPAVAHREQCWDFILKDACPTSITFVHRC